MLDISNFKDEITGIYNNKHGSYSNTIYTFDCEVVSLFKIDGQFQTFDYSKDSNYYRNIDKVAVPYIYQFGVNDNIYFSRDFMTFAYILEKISNKHVHKFIYVHNLAYDAQFIFNIIYIKNWHISDMIAVGKRKIISFSIDELNITFRCSYKLTNLSLANSAIKYKCKHNKLIGELDYNKAHSPKSKLSENEMAYCEYDLLVMYDFLSVFLKEYGSIKKIPLTQTGEVRYKLKKILPYSYYKEVAYKYPNPDMYYLLTKAFQGGITHSNYIHTNEVVKVKMFDISSSYPYVLLTKKFPTGFFFKIKPSDMVNKKNTHSFIIHCIFINLKCKKLNRYISDSKIINKHKSTLDNGRIIDCDYAEMVITNIDLDIIKNDYQYDKIEYINVFASRNHYLNINIVKFILDMYKQKTEQKGINEEFYMKAKQCINAMFGIACQNPIKNNVKFNLLNLDNIWQNPIIDNKLFYETVNNIKEHKNAIFQYQVGVWCTAYARKRLWDLIEYNKLTDYYSVYYDTDSDKLIDFDGLEEIILDLNKKRDVEVKEVCLNRNLNYSDFEPYDLNGKKYPIGIYDYEGDAELKTLGAKKYCTKKNGKFEITIAGVPKKKGSIILNNFEDFRKNFIFGYDLGKLTLYYNDGLQEPFTYVDCDGNNIYIDWCIFSVIAQPTTYELGISFDYEMLLNFYEQNL